YFRRQHRGRLRALRLSGVLPFLRDRVGTGSRAVQSAFVDSCAGSERRDQRGDGGVCGVFSDAPDSDILLYLSDSGAGVSDFGLLVCAAIPGGGWRVGDGGGRRSSLVGAHRRIFDGSVYCADGEERLKTKSLRGDRGEAQSAQKIPSRDQLGAALRRRRADL